MNEDKKLPIISVIILVIVLFTAIGFFILRKQTLVSPMPEGNNIRVIFTSPPPTNTPVVEPTASVSAKLSPTKKPAATATKEPTPSVKATVSPTKAPTVTP